MSPKALLVDTYRIESGEVDGFKVVLLSIRVADGQTFGPFAVDPRHAHVFSDEMLTMSAHVAAH